MIALTAASRAHYDNLVTHAKIVFRPAHHAVPGEMELSDVMRASLSPVEKESLLVVYALGTIKNGAFVAARWMPPVQTLVDLKDYAADPNSLADLQPDVHAQRMMRTAAATHLFGAGSAPKPGAPHTAVSARGKPAGEYRLCDLDAIVAHFDPRLAGTVVP